LKQIIIGLSIRGTVYEANLKQIVYCCVLWSKRY